MQINRIEVKYLFSEPIVLIFTQVIKYTIYDWHFFACDKSSNKLLKWHIKTAVFISGPRSYQKCYTMWEMKDVTLNIFLYYLCFINSLTTFWLAWADSNTDLRTWVLMLLLENWCHVFHFCRLDLTAFGEYCTGNKYPNSSFRKIHLLQSIQKVRKLQLLCHSNLHFLAHLLGLPLFCQLYCHSYLENCFDYITKGRWGLPESWEE